jgi:hypothetical protein
MASINVPSFDNIKSNFDQGHNGPFTLEITVPRAGAELRAKQYLLLHKLHGRAAKTRVKQSKTPSYTY